MNVLAWILLIFAAHAAMYYSLGTLNWFGTALLATVVWAAVIYAVRFLTRQGRRERS